MTPILNKAVQCNHPQKFKIVCEFQDGILTAPKYDIIMLHDVVRGYVVAELIIAMVWVAINPIFKLISFIQSCEDV